MSTHELKTWPEPYEAIVRGIKTFELRRNDRGFAVGDVLTLHEYDPEAGEYTGRYGSWKVSYMIDGSEGTFPASRPWDSAIMPGWCVLALGR